MSLKTLILMLFGFAIDLRSSAKFCVRRYVIGKWISKGDCGGPGRMSEMQKELQLKMKDSRKKCIAGDEWTVFQRRINGNVDFYRGWDDYKNGFGDCDGDLWLGLEELHERTKEGDMELEIIMTPKDGEIHQVAKYSNFRIGPESDKYRIHVSGHSGNVSNGLHYNGLQFATKDADDTAYHCTSRRESGWWYHYKCAISNLNGNFNKTGDQGIWWWNAASSKRFTEMKFRKKS